MDSVLLAAKNGSTADYTKLVVASTNYARKVISNLLGSSLASRVDVDDVLQEVFISVFKTLSTCRSQNFEEYLGWLATLCRNEVYSQAEKATRLKRDVRSTTAMSDDVPYQDKRSSTPEENAQLNETESRLLELARGYGNTGYAIVERMMGGMAAADIAEELDLEPSKVHKFASRYREQAKKMLQVAH